MLTLLGQSAQSLTELVWNVVAFAGLLLPAIGWLVSLLRYGLRWRRAALAGLFYAVALPLTFYLIVASTGDAIDLCLVLMLAPIGGFLGLGLLSVPAPRRLKPFDGRCPRCGYDLRATPQQCPECGEVPWHGAVW